MHRRWQQTVQSWSTIPLNHACTTFTFDLDKNQKWGKRSKTNNSDNTWKLSKVLTFTHCFTKGTGPDSISNTSPGTDQSSRTSAMVLFTLWLSHWWRTSKRKALLVQASLTNSIIASSEISPSNSFGFCTKIWQRRLTQVHDALQHNFNALEACKGIKHLFF